jgi:hypothetical protein
MKDMSRIKFWVEVPPTRGMIRKDWHEIVELAAEHGWHLIDAKDKAVLDASSMFTEVEIEETLERCAAAKEGGFPAPKSEAFLRAELARRASQPAQEQTDGE